MANKSLFASAVAMLMPRTDAVNREGAPAYAYGPEAKLAQLAATGTLTDNFYGQAEAQLADVLEAAKAVDPIFVAQAAIYARSSGAMKDMPALLAAYPNSPLSAFDGKESRCSIGAVSEPSSKTLARHRKTNWSK